MLKGIKDFVNDANKIIRRETKKITALHKEIEDYEFVEVTGDEAKGEMTS